MALKIEQRKDEEPKYSHFSHKHPLEYTKLVPDGSTTCFGCKLKILPGNYYYKCRTCSFFLHQVCFNMPRNANHPSDPNHSLTLQSIPSLSSKVSINCEACENQIKGFYYSCPKCIDYYHTLCLAAPLSIKAPFHHHVLNIEFSPLYDFECDLCEKPSYSGWLYHCNVCEFDAHLSCVLSLVHQNHRSAEAPSSTPDSASMGKLDELMELLTRGAKGVGDIKDQSFLSEDPTIPSFQLSDACFSIDFEKSLLCSDVSKDPASRTAKMEISEEKEIEESYNAKAHNRGLSNGVNAKSSSGIGSHVWSQMEQDSEKRLANGLKGKSDDVVSNGCSRLPKFLVRFFYIRWNRGPQPAKGEETFR